VCCGRNYDSNEPRSDAAWCVLCVCVNTGHVECVQIERSGPELIRAAPRARWRSAPPCSLAHGGGGGGLSPRRNLGVSGGQDLLGLSRGPLGLVHRVLLLLELLEAPSVHAALLMLVHGISADEVLPRLPHVELSAT